MRLTREKIIRLSHQLTDVLVASNEVEFVDDRDTIRQQVVKILTDTLREEEKADLEVRKKITSQKKEILEGSEEWDVLYRKYYADELRRLGIAAVPDERRPERSYYPPQHPTHIAAVFPAKKKKGRQAAPFIKLISFSYGVVSGRRFNVGRSSSGLALGSCPFLSACSVLVRKVGFPGAACTLRENTMFRSRAFTVSNSDVVTTYSCLAGNIRAISFWVFAMRSGVGGCVENIFGIVPGCRFSSA